MRDPHEVIHEELSQSYHLEDELGSGGMAVVYLARDRKHDRRVAIKVIRPELLTSIAPKRFEREVRITARLQHPHIVPLLDSGMAGELPYYVTPYVEGESLRERIQQRGRLPVEEALQIARDVASALRYAHEQGIVHRDIKPENILIANEQTKRR
jgi:serine/threonine protein kinase